jgi:hypothetical protein
MATRQQLTIRVSGFGVGTASLDDHSLDHAIVGLDLHVRAGEPTTAVLHLAGGFPADVEAEAEVRLPEEIQALLKRLGWTPPEEAN